jgi:hypothetical protein
VSQSGGVSVGAAVGAADGAIVAFVTFSAAANADAASVIRRLRRRRGIAIILSPPLDNGIEI